MMNGAVCVGELAAISDSTPANSQQTEISAEAPRSRNEDIFS